jgi:hypothetical protein
MMLQAARQYTLQPFGEERDADANATDFLRAKIPFSHQQEFDTAVPQELQK